MNLKSKIRTVPDYPIKGVDFKDFTTVLQDTATFKYVIDQLSKPYTNQHIDKIVAIDARGFLLAAPMAYNLQTGVCLVRKKGKLPYNSIEENYHKEYGVDVLTMHKDTILENEKVVIVDDVLATGGTIDATVKLIEKLKGDIIGISVLIDLPFLGGSQKFKKYNFNYLVKYDN